MIDSQSSLHSSGSNETGTPVSADVAWSLRRDGWGRLVLDRPGEKEIAGVQPVRCFPLTDPMRHIALMDIDGQEVLQISDLSQLPKALQNVVLAELSEREFVPEVLRILSVQGDGPPCLWNVETNRGLTTLQLESEDHLRKLGPRRILITDAHGVRYHIVDRDALDEESRRWLRKFL